MRSIFAMVASNSLSRSACRSHSSLAVNVDVELLAFAHARLADSLADADSAAAALSACVAAA